MHTVAVVGGEFALLAACSPPGHAFGRDRAGMVKGAQVFIPLWLIGWGIALWTGANRADYSGADAAPIFLGIFGVPAAIAVLVWRKFS